MDAICSTSIFSGSGTGGSDGDSSVKSSWCLPAVPVAGSDGDRDGLREDLYDMSSLMAQLPMHPLRLAGSVLISRRGLSRFYGGKSQLFRSLGDVKAVEDLPEPGRRLGRRVGCKKRMNVAHLHGCSTLSKVIRKATRM